MSGAEEFGKWFASVESAIEDSYIQARSSHASKDVQRSGHQGETAWVDVLKKWLPPHYEVATRKYIIGSPPNDEKPVETDIVVFNPAYPKPLRDQATVLASGVAAAFSVKLTFNKRHVTNNINWASDLQDRGVAGHNTVEDHLLPYIFTGVLAHSSDFGSSEVLLKQLQSKSIHINHPKRLVDVACVADLGTVYAERHAWYPMTLPFSDTGGVAPSDYRPLSAYIDSKKNDGFGPVAHFITTLYKGLGRRDPEMMRIAKQMAKITKVNGRSDDTRVWNPEDVYHPNFLKYYEHLLTPNGDFLVY